MSPRPFGVSEIISMQLWQMNGVARTVFVAHRTVVRLCVCVPFVYEGWKLERPAKAWLHNNERTGQKQDIHAANAYREGKISCPHSSRLFHLKDISPKK